MGDLLTRRHEMMLSGAGQTPPIPDGYITNGLVFFLDGLQLASSNAWTDIVGGKTFVLTNCSLGTKGVVFDGSAYGEYQGRITDDWESETIEVVFEGSPSGFINTTLFAQPYLNDSVGISMRFGYQAANTPRFAMALDGVNRSFYYMRLDQAKNRIGGNTNTVIVNGVVATSTYNTYYSQNTSGNTYVGAGRLSGGVTGFYTGTIYAVRIYSRKLSQNEINANQALDLTRYLS